MSKVTDLAISMARPHLRTGNAGAYAKILSGAHRAARRQADQKAIEDAIQADKADSLFTRSNGCLVAA